MPTRNILCTLYEYIPSEQCAIRESRRDKFHFSIVSRRNDASINNALRARSHESLKFAIISLDDYTVTSMERRQKEEGRGRNRSTIGKSDVRYLFLARDTSHNVETSLRIFGRGSTDGGRGTSSTLGSIPYNAL